MPLALAVAALALLVLYVELVRKADPGDAPAAPGAPPWVPDWVSSPRAESVELEPFSLVAEPAPVVLGGGSGFSPVLDFLRVDTPASVFQLPTRAESYRTPIADAERANGIPDGLLGRLLYQESRFRPEIINGTVRSPAGAVGIAQFMPATASGLGVDPLDPNSAIAGAGAYLRAQFDKFGTWALALAAYNWGPGNVQRKGLAQAPAETRKYVADILGDVGLG